MLNQCPKLPSTLVLISACFSATAETYKLDFHAEGLKYVTFSGVVKEPFVQTGSFIIDADPISQAINTIIAVDLVIDGHSYATSEIGVFSRGGSTFMIGGVLTGLATIATRTNDFFLAYTWGLPQSGYLVYASEASPGTASAFDVAYSLSPVPEPNSLVLAFGGLCTVLIAMRRTKSTFR